MHSFGFSQAQKPLPRWQGFSLTTIKKGLLVLVGFLLGINIIHVLGYANTSKQDILSGTTLTDLSLQVRGFDPVLSRGLLALDSIIRHQQTQTITATNKKDRAYIRQLLLTHPDSLTTLVGSSASNFIDTLSRFAQYQEDREQILGFGKPQTYLIILQNTAEKRPNGGFFGSFVKVVMDRGVMTSFALIDSYVPQILQPDTFIIGPEWINTFLPEREIFFVGANKIGFTYHDGANIKKLYERAYINETIKGVFFIRTDVLTKILPSLQEKLWERQFSNACVDLIRGEARSGKKETYIRDSLGFLKSSAGALIRGFFAQADNLLAKHYINIYMSDISGPLHTVLREGNLTTRFEEKTMYFWDSNISYNKIDQFIQKTIRFYDPKGDIVKETHEDIVPIADLPAGIYTVTIQYTMNVPDSYTNLIKKWENVYYITLTDRETHILGLTYDRSTRGVIYASKAVSLTSLSGDIYHNESFSTPFSSNIYYKTKIKGNGNTNVVSFQVEIR